MNCSKTQKVLCGNIDCTTCVSRSFATHKKSQYWSPNNELQPYQVLRSSNKKYLFDCKDCSHEIELALCNITIGQWCNYCNGNGLCLDNDCEFCEKKSFAPHPMAICWSNRNEYSPRNVLKSSDNKYWFDCSECNHDFEAVLYSVSRGTKCPYCTNQKMCNDCEKCYKKSCASHIMNDVWSSKNNLLPGNVFLQSNKKIIFNCCKCNHEYETTPNHYYNRNGSCPYCANKKLCQDINCNKCFEKSFASHPFVNCWSSKNIMNPRNVFKGSETKYVFDCDTCHSEFESKMYNVLTGYWCPYCKNKTEAKLLEFIKSNYKYYKTQMRFDWCRYSQTNNIMPFDFGLTDKKILIELDGEQHFNQVSNWDSPESVQSKDIEKINALIKNSYSIIHIYQKEVWNNTYDWKDTLINVIQYLEQTKEPMVLFVSCCDKYITHIQKLDNIKYEVINPQNFEF
jgi:very-short-patch-repair endonuclease